MFCGTLALEAGFLQKVERNKCATIWHKNCGWGGPDEDDALKQSSKKAKVSSCWRKQRFNKNGNCFPSIWEGVSCQKCGHKTLFKTKTGYYFWEGRILWREWVTTKKDGHLQCFFGKTTLIWRRGKTRDITFKEWIFGGMSLTLLSTGKVTNKFSPFHSRAFRYPRIRKTNMGGSSREGETFGISRFPFKQISVFFSVTKPKTIID